MVVSFAEGFALGIIVENSSGRDPDRRARGHVRPPEAARVRFYMASLIHAQITFALRLYGEVVRPSFEVDRTMHLALVLMVVLAMLASRLRREAGRASGRRRHDLVRRYSSGSHPVDARRES
jgi:hypothetical protein